MMFDRILNMPQPSQERKDIRDASIMSIDRLALMHPEVLIRVNQNGIPNSYPKLMKKLKC